MITANKILRILLTPLSWIYGMITTVRNWMFDNKLLPQESYKIPIVSVGNISVGGTGKTPHTEYIAEMLASSYNTAILSRGYKRKTKGFLIANAQSTPDSVGDEPLQMYHKLGNRVKVAVCESRREGIRELMKAYPNLELILLDDGFQHRYVKPKVSIVLMDYHRPIYEDKLLPLGRLRESAHQINRADMVIVTKCPGGLTPIDYRLVAKKLDLMPFQNLYFSHYNYGGLMPVFPEDSPYMANLGSLTSHDSVLLLTGIANPRYFVRYFRKFACKLKVFHFPDHHNFDRRDLMEIEERFNAMKGERKIIVTTEKDAIRLQYNPYYPNELKKITYYLPIGVSMESALENTDFITDLKKALSV